ncbi:MAG: BTAD domain-containing putative transcriptional regulator, partial [Chloroflexota bacterium]
MTNLHLQVLGAFQVRLGTRTLEKLPTEKGQALLAYLAIESERKHTRAELATLFWGELGEAAARANLRKSLFLLRQVFGDSLNTAFTLTHHDVQFRADNATVDLHQFMQLAQSENLAELERAIDLYRGQLLAGLDITGAPDFEDWLSNQREQIQQNFLTLLHKTGEMYLVQENYEASQAVARRQLALEPWREMAHRQLLRAYMAAGQRAEAVAQHEQFVSILNHEMGLEPSAETKALATAILHEQGLASQLHNFALPQTTFIGRERAINRIVARLNAPNGRLMTILGPGGIGKTRLAIEVVRRSMGLREAYFLPLEGLQTQADVWQLLGERLGIQSRAGSRIEREIITFLRERNPLLVFDNYEHLLPDTTCIEQLLTHAPNGQLLVTSRMPLNLSAEWQLPLDGLGLPPEGEQDIGQFPAVQLLLTAGQQVQPNLSLSDENAYYIDRICRRLAGMPLALEIAGSWLGLFSPMMLAEEIEKNIDILVATRKDIPERHRSLRAIFDHTLAQLNQAERTLLRQITIFHGDFSLRAVQTILQATPMALNTLVNHALLQRRRENHFGLHPILDAFLCEENDGWDASTLESQRRQHARYYLQRIAPICDYNVEVTVKDISYELANVRAAWDWAVTHDEADFLESAIDGQLAYYQFRGSFEEGRAQFSSAAAILSSPSIVHHLRFAEATCLQKLGHLDAAIRLIEPLTIHDDVESTLPALIRLAELYQAQEKQTLAADTLHKALSLADPGSEETAVIWNTLGIVYRHN